MVEGRAPYVKLVGDTAEGPHVDTAVILLLQHNLRGGIVERPYVLLRVRVGAAAKIPNFVIELSLSQQVHAIRRYCRVSSLGG